MVSASYRCYEMLGHPGLQYWQCHREAGMPGGTTRCRRPQLESWGTGQEACVGVPCSTDCMLVPAPPGTAKKVKMNGPAEYGTVGGRAR
jgi:hypothetical protein